MGSTQASESPVCSVLLHSCLSDTLPVPTMGKKPYPESLPHSWGHRLQREGEGEARDGRGRAGPLSRPPQNGALHRGLNLLQPRPIPFREMPGDCRGPQRIMEEGARVRRASGPLACPELSPTHPGLSAELSIHRVHSFLDLPRCLVGGMSGLPPPALRVSPLPAPCSRSPATAYATNYIPPSLLLPHAISQATSSG